MRVDKLRVEKESPFCDKAISEIAVFSEFNLLLVGIDRGQHQMIFKPSPTEIVREDDILIVVGAVTELSLLKQVMRQTAYSSAETAGQVPSASSIQ